MNRTLLLVIFILPSLFLQNFLFSQEKGYTVGYKLEGRDTIYQITLREVYHYSWDNTRKKGREWRQFYRLVYNFEKTYPYALKAKSIVKEADSVLANSNFNAKEFEQPLRKMSFSQGKLLLKLIDREIGQSSYYIIKNYRGGAAAGFWQGVAKIFGSDLKKPYDRFEQDRLTEELVQMYHRGTFQYLYYSIFR